APARRPQHVVCEEQGEIDDHADDRRGDRGERRGEPEVAVRRLDQRCADEDEQERRQEGDEGGHGGRRRGPGVVSPRARPSIICAALSHWCCSTAPWNT